MKMKRISAATLKDAMELARRELGEDSILIDTKKNPAGGLIVTFAVDQEDEKLFDDEPVQTFADSIYFQPEIPKPAAAKVELSHPAHDIIAEVIAYHAIPAPLGDALMRHVERTPLKPDSLLEVAQTALAQALTSHVKFQPLVTNAAPTGRAVMLVGPHGAGKTSTIAKIATELTLHKKRILLISTDTERLGGPESLQLLAGMLKCEFAVCESRAKLKSLVTAAQGKIWVLIDSSGANIYEFSQLKALGELAGLQGIEPILTCPAGMDSAEAVEMASVFNFLNMERMIVTRLDAVRRLGSVFAALSTGGYALSNFTDSAIPTDPCHTLSAAALARLMLRHVRERMEH